MQLLDHDAGEKDKESIRLTIKAIEATSCAVVWL